MLSTDSQVDELAAQLVHAAGRQASSFASLRWWQSTLLDAATADPAFRVQLLRFVDVLPMLHSHETIAEHVLEYFGDSAHPLVQRGARLAVKPLLQPVLAGLVKRGVLAMASRFIAGATAQAALPQLRRLLSHGQAYTLDLLGEATLADSEAEAYLARYQELIAFLSHERTTATRDDRWTGVPAINVSIKLSAFCAHFEPAAPEAVIEDILPLLRALARTARAHGAFINVDMEQHRYKDLVHRVFAALALDKEFRDWDGLGIVVQAYLRDGAGDLAWVEALAKQRGTPVTVRLVKGAYWDEEVAMAAQNNWPLPVFQAKAETDAAFDRLTGQLLEAWPQLRPAFGTHNPHSIAQAAVKARLRGLRETGFEFQMLYGLAPEIAAAVTVLGYRVRSYAPVGAILPGMAYLVRRLLENTSNEAWFRRPLIAPAGEAEQRLPAPASVTAQPAFSNAPPARFFDPEVRTCMTQALEHCRSQFGVTYPLLLAGTEQQRSETSEVRYPADPAVVLGRVAQATPEDVSLAVAAGLRVLPAWRNLPVHSRADILRRAASMLDSRRYAFAALMAYECAKPWHEADGDVTEAVDYLRYYAQQAQELQRPQGQLQEPLGERNDYVREARGVTAVIAPWNFPLAILTGMTVAALATGNTVVMKPSGFSPIVAYHLVRLLHEAGVPPEAVQYVPGSGEQVGQALVGHPEVSTIAFTGSNAVGLGIIARAAQLTPGQRLIKTVIAELGGKNAIIIDEDADVDMAVADAVVSAFGYAGQKCSACSRLIIVGSAYETMAGRLREAVQSLVVGPPDRPETFVPPVISAAAQERISRYARLGQSLASVVAMGNVPDGPGYYVAPAVFGDVPLDSPLAVEEIFGPVLSVFRAATFEQALSIANNTPFGLTGGLFSRQPRHIEQARRELRVGNLYINRKVTGAVVGRQAFGGLNLSGAGEKAGGPDYVRQFTVSRTVTENTMRRGFAPPRPVDAV